MAFDARGRLWVSRDRRVPLPDAGRARAATRSRSSRTSADDGRARKITTFADGLNIPIGVLPLSGRRQGRQRPGLQHPQRLPPDATRDGDGKADRREPFYATYGFADTHGMTNSFTWGFDGWVYACHGFTNTSTIKGADGRPITMQSGNTYRMKPDGSHLEQWTWGQVNPFGLCFDPLGNLYSCDCHSQPIYQLLRGATIPSFGKPHDGLGFGPEAITFYHDSTAIAGIAYYAADHYPPAYRDAAFIGDVVTNRVNQFRLEWHGSSPRGDQARLPAVRRPWFRPVDVKLGPDGALYIADFYNRIIGHYEVPLTHPGRDRERGRIWRIVCRGPDGKVKPLGPRAGPDPRRRQGTGRGPGQPEPGRADAGDEPAGRARPARRAEAVRAVMWPDRGAVPARCTACGCWNAPGPGRADAGGGRQRTSTAACASTPCACSASGRKLTPAAARAGRGGAATTPTRSFCRAAADALGRHPTPENLPAAARPAQRRPGRTTRT